MAEQLAWIDAKRFDLAVVEASSGRQILRRNLSAQQLLALKDWLERCNRAGSAIYFRPIACARTIGIGQLSARSLQQLQNEVPVSMLVELAPATFEAWITHGRDLSTTERTLLQWYYRERSSAEPAHMEGQAFFALAGFTFPEKRTAPVRLVHASGVALSLEKTRQVLLEAARLMEQQSHRRTLEHER
jgi:hypothetical protein